MSTSAAEPEPIQAEPAERQPVERRPVKRKRHIDVTTYVTWFVVCLIAIPEVYVVRGPLGGLGAPAIIVAFGGLAWWIFATLYPGSGLHRGLQPIRWALFALVASILVSLAMANRGSIPGDQARLADRGVLLILAMAGIALLIADGMDSLERLQVLLQRIVTAVACISVVGIIEYETTNNFVASVFNKIPLLSPTMVVPFADFRAELNSSTRRVSGTAIHPIEFAVVLAMALPLAAHYALTDEVRHGWRRWWKVAVIFVAQPLAQSRSGIIAIAVAAVILLPAWPRAVRQKLYVWAIPAAIAGRVLFPGLLGTVRNLFLNYKNDPSYKDRIARYPKIFRFIHQHPWFGRGFQTFDAKTFFATDNQYLMSLIETGIIGTLVLIALFVTAVVLATSTKKWAQSEHERMLAQALLASTAGVAVSFATWDVFAYIMATGMIFLLLGSAGALWRLQRERARAPANGATAVQGLVGARA